MRKLVWFRRLAAGAVGAVVLVAACEYLFDTARPKIQFVTPGEADTVYSPVVFELNVQDGGFKALDLYVDGARVKTYSSSHVLDSLAMPAGGHVLSARAFDKGGNYTLGVREQTIFPEIDPNDVTRSQGMDITIVTSAKSNDEAHELLSLLGMQFSQEADRRADIG